MARVPLIPPHEAPPASWQAPDGKFKWPFAIVGLIVGAGIAVAAFTIDRSPWWWMAAPAGLAFGWLGRSTFRGATVIWWRK
jgi:hypothetical protein